LYRYFKIQLYPGDQSGEIISYLVGHFCYEAYESNILALLNQYEISKNETETYKFVQNYYQTSENKPISERFLTVPIHILKYEHLNENYNYENFKKDILCLFRSLMGVFYYEISNDISFKILKDIPENEKRKFQHLRSQDVRVHYELDQCLVCFKARNTIKTKTPDFYKFEKNKLDFFKILENKNNFSVLRDSIQNKDYCSCEEGTKKIYERMKLPSIVEIWILAPESDQNYMKFEINQKYELSENKWEVKLIFYYENQEWKIFAKDEHYWVFEKNKKLKYSKKLQIMGEIIHTSEIFILYTKVK